MNWQMFRSPSFRAAMVIGVLLLGMTLGFFQALATTINHRAQDNLEQQWAAMKGYLRTERTPTRVSPNWYLDRDDGDEVSAVARIRRHYLLTDREGRPLEISRDYPAIHADSPPEIRGRVRDNQITLRESPAASRACCSAKTRPRNPTTLPAPHQSGTNRGCCGRLPSDC